MSNIFGITTQSILSVQQALHKYAKSMNNFDVSYNKINKTAFAKADLVLLGNLKTYNSSLPLLKDTKKVAIVFDSPIILHNQTDITVLDRTNSDVLTVGFSNVQIDYTPVIKALKKPEVVNPARISIDVLTDIIKDFSAAGFLDKFNTYIYQATTVKTKPAVRNDIILYVFGKTTLDQMLANTHKHGAKNGPESKALLKHIIDYMQSDAGKKLREALLKGIEMENAASTNARRTISYKKLTEEFNVDKFELRNLMLLYRSKN